MRAEGLPGLPGPTPVYSSSPDRGMTSSHCDECWPVNLTVGGSPDMKVDMMTRRSPRTLDSYTAHTPRCYLRWVVSQQPLLGAACTEMLSFQHCPARPAACHIGLDTRHKVPQDGGMVCWGPSMLGFCKRRTMTILYSLLGNKYCISVLKSCPMSAPCPPQTGKAYQDLLMVPFQVLLLLRAPKSPRDLYRSV